MPYLLIRRTNQEVALRAVSTKGNRMKVFLDFFFYLTWTIYTSSLPLYQISNFFTSPLTFSVIPTAVICQETHTHTVNTDTRRQWEEQVIHQTYIMSHICPVRTLTFRQISDVQLLPHHILNNESKTEAAAADTSGVPLLTSAHIN